jgi:hypothetical protein
MTEERDDPKAFVPEERDPLVDESRDSSADESVRELLKNALGKDEPSKVDVLAGVQRKLRERSGGKFYADRWSTSRQPPVVTYLVTSLFMLAIAFAVYLVLAPLRGQARAVDPDPAPVQLLPP